MMKIEDIWKWRREKLRKLEGGWVSNVFLLIYIKLDDCGPRQWGNCFSISEAVQMAQCYLEVIRIAGGVLNDMPNHDKARALYFDTVEQADIFKKESSDITDGGLMLEELKDIMGRCLQLARDTENRLASIRARGGF